MLNFKFAKKYYRLLCREAARDLSSSMASTLSSVAAIKMLYHKYPKIHPVQEKNANISIHKLYVSFLHQSRVFSMRPVNYTLI
jgi:hypothetical protein